jgi:hypothetical protein
LYPCLVSPRASCFTAVVRLVYEHHAPAHPDLARHASQVAETDRLDSAQLTLEDVVRDRPVEEVVCLLYGGGGHAGDGACLPAPATTDARIAEIVSTLERNG